MISPALSSADLTLAARLEAAEAENLMQLTRSAAVFVPDAAFEPVAGGLASFAGVGSPMTHCVGIGLRGHVHENELEGMEAFFRERGSPCIVDLCPLADPSVIAFVQTRPYRVIEFNNVLARRISPDETWAPVQDVKLISESDLNDWVQVVGEGFSEYMPVTQETRDLLAATSRNTLNWIGGEESPVSGAAMGVQNGVALFFGDATLVSARRKGWHSRLIRARLIEAQRRGCDLATVAVLPGSISHRNYERAGFQLIYMRINLSRDF